MNSWQQFEASLKFEASRLIYLDVTKFGLTDTPLYFYLDYMNHAAFSGNKLRKLYGTLKRLQGKESESIITVGGNYSNYLHACGYLPELMGVNLIVIIKGHEPSTYGSTLQHLVAKGAMLHFYPRSEVKSNLNEIVNDLKRKYPNSIFIPEGGTNEYSHEGFQSLIHGGLRSFNTICVPVGTLGTYKGVETYLLNNQKLVGYAAHLDYSLQTQGNIIYEYGFGGFAKMTDELFSFCQRFNDVYGIQLDPVYTSKMMYGIFQDIQTGRLSNEAPIVAVHTGGLQGWNGALSKYLCEK